MVKKRRRGGLELRVGTAEGRISFYGKDLATLRKKFNAWKEVNQAIMNKNKNYTVKDWINIWMKTYKKANVKADTCKIMGYVIDRHIVSKIGEMKISQVRNIDCQKLLNELNNTPNTQKKVYIYLRDIFSKAVCCKIKSSQPMPSVALTREEQRRLVNF